ncbi:protein AKNAD1 isoform X2 [Amphiprion ocellaris]|uniref:protein AKNAD1 isoform X2 n=1 Tax=Amphiprion ocellaris TaxID=80972 RepID=UPI0024119211|nr:protein AKNAD1 isoform X2 [Amphiprion ocellaris]
MEGDPEESDEDVQGDDKPTVLWEKHFEQSIFVDLSEDESLHFSDLESSLALRLSQTESAASEASIHLSGSAELSPLNETSSEISSVSSQSVRVEKSKTRSSKLHVSVQRPNTMQDQGYEDPGQNTSDEDQEDLPFDGDLRSPYFNQTGSSEENGSSDGRCTVHASPELPGLFELLPEDASCKQENFLEAAKPSVVALPCPGPIDINQVLLQHFSQEELLRPGRLIEAETLPEVSLLESVDDTLFSLAPTCNSAAICSNHTESCHEKSNIASKNTNLKGETQKETDHFTSAAADNDMSGSVSTESNQCSGDVSAEGVEQEEAEEDDEVQRVPLLRTRSFSEMKYGQGQVHYPLPDFSKVAPKVKIPKTPSGPVRSVPQCQSTMHRAQSSPVMLEVISRVLEESVQPSEKPYVFKDDDKQSPPALVHHLQAEYDKLLTKYAEAENLIDQMRLGTNAQPSSELMLDLEHDADHLDADQGELVDGSHLGAPHLSPPENLSKKVETTLNSTVKEATTASSSQPQDDPSDGERMTTELRDIISQFIQKVEEFKFSVSTKTASTEEQQMMLRSMMEAQDQLERNYMSKKDEHRALEMQNYMGLSRNTGAFDPNRLVEGDIFRIGMHLEDIKEMIEKNVCEQISLPNSSSTPTPVTASQHVKSSPLCMPVFSSPPSPHEGPSAGFSTVSDEMDVQREEEGEEKEASEVHINGRLDQSSEFITDDPLMNNSGRNNHQSRVSLDSLEALNIHTAEDKEGDEEKRSSVLSEVIDHRDILANRDGTSSASTQRQQTAGSSVLCCSTLDGVLNLKGECDLGDCVSLAVEVSSSSDALRDSDGRSLSEPPLNTSQRIVSPETDSGFGSSYLNQSASGWFQPNLLSQSGHYQNESLSNSDSEDSCSNLQTTIHSAALPGHQWADTHPSVQTQHCEAAAAVELWVESTTKEPSGCLQGSDQNLPAQLHLSQPLLSSAMDTEDRGSPLYSCSCNNEAILALQSEVSRLKKDLEVGLVQLPHLEQKMDYLTSKYRQDRQERRSKTRIHQRPACNSAGKSSSRGVSNLRSSKVRIEDWISSDMDLSKSKGTGSGNTSCSEIMTQEINSPVGSRRGGRSLCSTTEFQYRLQETTQTDRGTVGNTGFKLENSGNSESNVKQRAQTIMKSFHSKDRWALLSSPSLQKPLLQVSYSSSSSLPASYKMREPPLQSMSHYRKRSTQSDSALLPSNVYFQRTLSPASVAFKTGSRTSRRSRTKEEDMNKTLDQAIEVARSMKRTTDHMARRLSADLAKAQLHRKLHNMQPLGGRKHQAL